MTKIPRYLYHLTDGINIQNILKTGLEPRIGVHSQFVEETEKQIYMSDYDSLPYWKIFFAKTAILRIDTEKLDKTALTVFNYDYYSEYIYTKMIPYDAISITVQSYQTLTEQQLLDFKLSILDTVSNISLLFARYITYLDEYPEDALEDLEECLYLIKIFKYYTTCIDLSDIPSKALIAHLKYIGNNGMYTFCDHYECGNFDGDKHKPRLWQMLGKHDLATDETKWLYNYLRTTFPRRLFIETGGWTG